MPGGVSHRCRQELGARALPRQALSSLLSRRRGTSQSHRDRVGSLGFQAREDICAPTSRAQHPWAPPGPVNLQDRMVHSGPSRADDGLY